MSQNNSQKGKFQGFPGNQARGHTDFGQAGYPQYPFPPGALSGVPQANELSKQVQAAQQQGMYATSTSQGQQSMGPSASPQQPNPMNAQQQQHLGRTAHVTTMPNYYTRSNVVPRTLPGMGRAPLTTVVNQGGGAGSSGGQQPPSTPQYSHTVQMVPSHAFHHHPMQPIIVNTHHQLTAPQMYQQRPNYQQQYSVIPAGQQIYLNNQWANYNSVAATNSNGYYQPHPALSSFNAMPPQLPPQMGGTQQPAQSQPLPPAPNRKNPLPIIDPTTGKNILDGLNQESVTPPRSSTLHEKETENADPNICVQFATQVAAALANNDKTDMPAKAAPIVETRVIPEPQMCPVEPPEEETYQSRSRPEPFYEIDTSIPVEEYREESPSPVRIEPELVPEPDPPACEEEVCQEEEPVVEAEDMTPVLDSPQEKSVGFVSVQELNKVNAQLAMDMVNVSQEATAPPTPVVESYKEPPPIIEEKVETITIVNSTKPAEKLSSIESKKNKTRKKKDLNKKGESKEGGEMDAFLDKGPEEERVPPMVEEQRPLSPVPVVDSDILDSIPLPPEPAPSPPNGEKASEDKENSPAEDAASKLILKYEYKEDQWSPLNPEGKKQYDRDFLLQLQGEPMSLCKPSNLPNLDVIKDKAHIQRLTEVNRVTPMTMPMKAYNDPFVPTYARGGAQRPPHPSIGRRSQQGGRGPEKPKKVISFSSSLNQAVKLHESENAWKPIHKQEVPAEDNLETQELYRRVRGILNKLTPQKFETLVEQVKGFDINTEEKLNGVIDLVFEKAIDEPNFSVPYANMCKQLKQINVPLAGQPGQYVNFRKLLLTKCQKEFEQDTRDELKREERLKAIESADQDKKKELQFEFDEEEKKMRYRQLGNIRFIGELFKLNMLTEPIMHDCIQKLLTQGDEESLECLCRLLKTIGKELEGNPDGKPQRGGSMMDKYFGEMQKIVEKRLTTSRVRFMLQDVIDLKRNNWVPRRDENNPKTIDQIHKEVEREAREQQQSYQNMPPSSSTYPKRLNTDDRRKGGMGRNIGISDDGWIPSSNKSNKGSYMVDPTKLKLTKPDEVESMRLGPGGRGLQSWGRGSSGGNKTSPAEEKASAALTTNRYSALADQTLTPNFEGRRGSQRSAASSRESSRGRSGAAQPPPIRKTSSTSKERESLLETVKGLARTGQPAQESRTVTQATEPSVKRAPLVEEQRSHMNGKVTERDALTLRGPELDEEELEKKTKPLIDEFLHNADFEEAIKCVTELCCPTTVHLFIEYAVNQVLERSSQARTLLGQLFYLLTSRQIFTLQQYKNGFNGVLSNVDDYALDIPLIWDYIGEILEPMVDDNKMPLSFLKEVLEPCRPSLTAGKLVSAVLCSAKKKGTFKLGEAWRESGLQWTDFLGTSENVEDFVHTYKLEFTVTPTKTSPLSTELSPEEMRKELSSLLQNNKKNEEIFDWIDANVSQMAVTEPSFIRALVSAVHENAIHGSGQNSELIQAKLKERIPLLTRYIEHKENLELQALYAIQSLMNQLDQPKGVLRQIFDLLYDDDVITDETFKRWEQSSDPDEMVGKAVALLSVSPFFTWLREAESGDSDPPEEEPRPT